MLHTISSERLTVRFDDTVGEVTTADFDGIVTLKPPTYGTWPKTWPVMFPICGKLKDGKYLHEGRTYELPGHGFFRSLKWSVNVAADKRSLYATAVNCADFLPVYPFRFAVSLTLTVKGSTLSYEMHIHNVGEHAMYFNSGHHETFLVDPREYKIVLKKPASFTKYMEVGGTGPGLDPVTVLSAKNLDLDTGCSYQTVNSGVHRVTLYSGKGFAAHLRFDQFNVFTVWAKPHSDWICLEPWNGNQDVGNEQPRELARKPLVQTLQPGADYKDGFTITYEKE